ncbi:Uncharacterized protein APZ42_027844 [Daphnia magna]|uniref:Uncharacterized protein n=1 Tax=Daphnia magna TaxID=35525 RepID=A0A164R0T8_9CRUS|nr:Uncharacterized protein APZ42_027844 [Daphnia magna]
MQNTEYDTTFDLGNFYVNWLSFRHTEFEDLPGNPIPTISLACFLYSKKLPSSREYFSNMIKEEIPRLAEAKNIIICTDEEQAIVNAIEKESKVGNNIFSMNPYAEEAEFSRLESEHLKELDKEEGNGPKWYFGDERDEDQYKENDKRGPEFEEKTNKKHKGKNKEPIFVGKTMKQGKLNIHGVMENPNVKLKEKIKKNNDQRDSHSHTSSSDTPNNNGSNSFTSISSKPSSTDSEKERLSFPSSVEENKKDNSKVLAEESGQQPQQENIIQFQEKQDYASSMLEDLTQLSENSQLHSDSPKKHRHNLFFSCEKLCS